MRVYELKSGQLFMLVSPENTETLFSYVGPVYAADNTLSTCEIEAVAFKVDDSWQLHSNRIHHNCNPHASVKVIKFPVN